MSERPEKVTVVHLVTRSAEGEEEVTQILESEQIVGEVGVLERLRNQKGGPGPEEVVTHFAASASPAPAYPRNFPFIATFESWVTQFPNGEFPTGARWLSKSDPTSLVSELIRQSTNDGWVQVSDVPARIESGSPFPIHAIRLRRAEMARMISWTDYGGQGVVQLLDMLQGEFPDDARS